jgi:hypothetical protein
MIRVTGRGAGKKRPRATKTSEAELDGLIEKAIVDAILSFRELFDRANDMPRRRAVRAARPSARAVQSRSFPFLRWTAEISASGKFVRQSGLATCDDPRRDNCFILSLSETRRVSADNRKHPSGC